jgi:hypothetical protein
MRRLQGHHRIVSHGASVWQGSSGSMDRIRPARLLSPARRPRGRVQGRRYPKTRIRYGNDGSRVALEVGEKGANGLDRFREIVSSLKRHRTVERYLLGENATFGRSDQFDPSAIAANGIDKDSLLDLVYHEATNFPADSSDQSQAGCHRENDLHERNEYSVGRPTSRKKIDLEKEL